MSQMAVVGYDVEGNEILGEVMGDVDGDDMVVGRRRSRGARQIRIPQKPNWRNQLAPGVIQPDEGMVPLTLAGNSGTNTFTAAIQTITFQGQLQKPYRPERLLTSTIRTGTTAVGRLLTVLYVGTDLQQADINGWDAELVGLPGAFGTRLTCKAAEPGVLVRAVVSLSTALAGTDTIQANFTFMGRIIH